MSAIDVILVDRFDRPTGKMEKLEAHQKGLLHRAVTVYVFNSRNELLLQRRASDKYHCGGLWSNTCCGHPLPDETSQTAAERRLEEEMGLRLTLTPMFELSYNLPLSNGLIEHEYGHVFFAISDQTPHLNPQEADDSRWLSLTAIQQEIARDPARFTPWFLHTFARIPDQLARFIQRGAALKSSASTS
ncbi:MAG: isopentenyl-diphosphate Delta-isomerase [Mixta calida]|jgi:isopentenyl-diphosphate delta-isomerase|uniref:Isopentenyl-diphosphate Delta-isomerase n=1 Tax=Mixta calida TaxID=665913 RepID=A0ABM6RZP3_9GAMM|nr:MULTISPECIES: isopentenyl-diphosphate Delta-isomerase [Mixta]MBS6056722.1 isopentenyl-diphosphate Delta-isomerase [Pantoea sp.]POU51747.1 isopentenyl-diphosphate Delta-isomerase [Pantoea sp. PSNIH5]POU69542.1 isopentenyl-diphosphate Delta-isomerase [Pantoea sp. PSNIH4]POY69288.1 isopentenyl-diphosphate Delta-isomerase [Pantoea sp. PSNIH3]AUY24687.1 isopentenyl-diphosphate Delta-isomerase [Mixta calida]